MSRPLVFITSCNESPAYGTYSMTRKSYTDAIRRAGCLPLIMSADGSVDDLAEMLDRCDGLLFTGSPSNVHPSLYGKELHPSQPMRDEIRDAWTLPLLRAATEQHIPLLAICRGFQEFNVALGGSLHQRLREVPDFENHMAYETDDLDQRYALAHDVSVREGGMLHRIVGVKHMRVNSVHNQGVDQLAPNLCIEARSDDGVIEAVSPRDAKTFQLGVQWHPEWRSDLDEPSTKIFRAFAAACADRAHKKHLSR